MVAPDARAATLKDALVIATSVALLTAIGEVALTAYRWSIQGRVISVSYDFAWLTPAAYITILVPAAAALQIAAWVAGRPFRASALAGLLAAAGAFATLLPHSAIAWWASIVLAIGFGFRVATSLADGPQEVWIRRLARAGAVAAVLMAFGAAGMRALRADWTADLTTAPAANRPNVLLIVLDTVRAASLSVYGYDKPTTPKLERWSREGVVFEHAISTAPWTLPSHGSLLTGQEPDELGASFRLAMPDGPRTLAETLTESGYATAGFVSNLMYTAWDSGLARGFSHYDGYRLSWERFLQHSALGRMDAKTDSIRPFASWSEFWDALRSSRIQDSSAPAKIIRPADDLAAAFLDWSASLEGRPFFAFINLMEAHFPYPFPSSFDGVPGVANSERERYDHAIAWLDDNVNTVLSTLQTRGLLNNTLVIVTSDHGEQFGEHGLIGHANSLYLPVIHVPLIMRLPSRVPSATRIDSVVSLKDVPATILDLLGLADDRIPGQSLAAAWRNPGVAMAPVRAVLEVGVNVDASHRNSVGTMISALDNRFHYVKDGEGKEEFYDYVSDPEERVNLIGDARYGPQIARLRARAQRAGG